MALQNPYMIELHAVGFWAASIVFVIVDIFCCCSKSISKNIVVLLDVRHWDPANVVLKVYGYRLTEIVANPNARNSINRQLQLMLAVVVPSPIITLTTNTLLNLPMHFTMLRVQLQGKRDSITGQSGDSVDAGRVFRTAMRRTFHPAIVIVFGSYATFSTVALFILLGIMLGFDPIAQIQAGHVPPGVIPTSGFLDGVVVRMDSIADQIPVSNSWLDSLIDEQIHNTKTQSSRQTDVSGDDIIQSEEQETNTFQSDHLETQQSVPSKTSFKRFIIHSSTSPLSKFAKKLRIPPPKDIPAIGLSKYGISAHEQYLASGSLGTFSDRFKRRLSEMSVRGIE
ncbi:hypothetical protein BSLG_005849 [Batrachochytrium salamandrivorans]|nr:hypothetical protein BSLG_005849 [Batrachochytrium salamandrivorans]